MKIRLMIVLISFTAITSFIVIPFFNNLSYFFQTNDSSLLIRTIQGDKIVSGSNKFTHSVELIKSCISRSLDIARTTFWGMNKYSLAAFFMSLFFLVIAALIFSTLVSISYLEICKKLDDMKSNEYSFVLSKKGYFPELTQKVNELSEQLYKEKESGNKTSEEERKRLETMVQQAQKMITTAKGQLEVLNESGIINEECHENVLLNETYKNICEAGRLISDYKIQRFD